MKRISSLLIFCLIITCSLFSQVENPYAEFGCNATVLDVSHQDFDKIIYASTDTLSRCFKIIVNFKLHYVTFLDKEDRILLIKEVPQDALLRWLTFDPAHQHSSPYLAMGNNPVSGIDPDGREDYSTHTDKAGNVVAVYNDGDRRIYRHDDLSNWNGNDILTKTGAGITMMGVTPFWDEFINPVTKLAEGKIRFGESWEKIINDLHEESKDMTLIGIALESKPGGMFDIKVNANYSPDGIFTGKLLNREYVSGESAGNYLAGYNARYAKNFGLPWDYDKFMRMAGALHKGRFDAFTAYMILSSDFKCGKAPWYGEIEYAGRMIKNGWGRRE